MHLCYRAFFTMLIKPRNENNKTMVSFSLVESFAGVFELVTTTSTQILKVLN